MEVKNNEENIKLWIAAVKENGVYLRYEDSKSSYLSLNDINQTEEVDVWGDGLFVSAGFFIKPELAWRGIYEFMNNASLCKEITWIDYNEVSEELIEEYTKIYGMDAGYEQQQFQILEDMEHRIEVTVR